MKSLCELPRMGCLTFPFQKRMAAGRLPVMRTTSGEIPQCHSYTDAVSGRARGARSKKNNAPHPTAAIPDPINAVVA
jgi:hypothetical protein